MKRKYYPPIILNGVLMDYRLEELKKRLKEKGAKFKNKFGSHLSMEHITYELGNSKLEIDHTQNVKKRWPYLDAEIFAYITSPDKDDYQSKKLKDTFKEVFYINKRFNKETNWAEKIFSN